MGPAISRIQRIGKGIPEDIRWLIEAKV